MRTAFTKTLFSGVAVCTFCLPSQLTAQGINLGDLFSKAMQPMLEVAAIRSANMKERELVFNTDSISATSNDTVVTFTVTNPYSDSARFVVKLHSILPPKAIWPEGNQGHTTQNRNTTTPSHGKSKGLFAEGSPQDSTGALLRDLTPHISVRETGTHILAPGESKVITVSLSPDLQMTHAEYIAWVAAHLVVGENATVPDSVIKSYMQRIKETDKVNNSAVEVTWADRDGAEPDFRIPVGTEIISSAKILFTPKK